MSLRGAQLPARGIGFDWEEYLRHGAFWGPWFGDDFNAQTRPVAYNNIRQLTVIPPERLSPEERARLQAIVDRSQETLRTWERKRASRRLLIAGLLVTTAVGLAAFSIFTAGKVLQKAA